MGGKLPPFIEVRSPVIDTRMKIDIPEGADYNFLCHDNLVALCLKTMSTVEDWDVIIRKHLAEGAHMELAWRFDTNLDWVWWLDDINGNSRTWAVLAGLALNQVFPFIPLPFILSTLSAPGRKGCVPGGTVSPAHGPTTAHTRWQSPFRATGH